MTDKYYASNVETILERKINHYIGKSESELREEFGIPDNQIPKNFYSMLTFRMLNISGNSAKELTESDIDIRTIRLDKQGNLKESMSFKAFKFNEIVEQSWEESDIRIMLSTKKYLFVVFKLNENGEYILKGSQVWNMPYEDIENEVKKVFEKTKLIISDGIIITDTGKRKKSNLPSSSENVVCHVRPHAQNSQDTYPTPDGKEFTKQSFWLNNKYIQSQLKSQFFE